MEKGRAEKKAKRRNSKHECLGIEGMNSNSSQIGLSQAKLTFKCNAITCNVINATLFECRLIHRNK